jgi:GTP pyrophosphokinase
MSETESPTFEPVAPVLAERRLPDAQLRAAPKELFYTYIKNPEDRKMVEDAYHLADLKHKGVLRKSGEPYIHHPIEVAYILAQLQSGPRDLGRRLIARYGRRHRRSRSRTSASSSATTSR